LLTQSYLEEHADNAKNNKSTKSDYESFGRAVAELILREGAKQVQGGGKETVTFKADVTLSKNHQKLCVTGKICVAGICVDGHVGL
jgi:hypothetical protein